MSARSRATPSLRRRRHSFELSTRQGGLLYQGRSQARGRAAQGEQGPGRRSRRGLHVAHPGVSASGSAQPQGRVGGQSRAAREGAADRRGRSRPGQAGRRQVAASPRSARRSPQDSGEGQRPGAARHPEPRRTCCWPVSIRKNTSGRKRANCGKRCCTRSACPSTSRAACCTTSASAAGTWTSRAERPRRGPTVCGAPRARRPRPRRWLSPTCACMKPVPNRPSKCWPKPWPASARPPTGRTR